MGRLLQLNLGLSARTSQPVTAELMGRLPHTIQLATASIILAMVAGVIAGVIAARGHGSVVDYLVSAFTLEDVSSRWRRPAVQLRPAELHAGQLFGGAHRSNDPFQHA
jgi:ABC-type antimicrobial peptide transport system permease subunit